MIEPQTDTFTRSEWLAALLDLPVFCAGDEAGCTADRIREMNALLRLVPAGADLAGTRALNAARLAALLGPDCGESAVLAMLGHDTGFLLSRSGDGHSFATLALPGAVPEQSCSGSTPALALIGALALSLYEAQGSTRALTRRTGVEGHSLLH